MTKFDLQTNIFGAIAAFCVLALIIIFANLMTERWPHINRLSPSACESLCGYHFNEESKTESKE